MRYFIFTLSVSLVGGTTCWGLDPSAGPKGVSSTEKSGPVWGWQRGDPCPPNVSTKTYSFCGAAVIFLEKANKFYREGNYQEAYKAADMVLRIDSSNSRAQEIVRLTSAHKPAPRSPNRPLTRKEREEVARKMMRIPPPKGFPFARLLTEKADHEEIVRPVRSELAAKPGNLHLISIVMESDFMLGLNASAERASSQFLAEIPDDPSARQIRAAARYNLGRYGDALRDMEFFARQKSVDPLGRYLQGVVLRALGRSDEAREAFDKASELDPDLKAALERMLTPPAPKSP